MKWFIAVFVGTIGVILYSIGVWLYGYDFDTRGVDAATYYACALIAFAFGFGCTTGILKDLEK